MVTDRITRLAVFFLILSSTVLPFSSRARIYFIGFTDRNNSPYSISRPSDFLSQRSIDRRIRYNIALNDNDLPVNPAYRDSLIAHGAMVLNQIKWLNGVTVSCDSSVMAALQTLPFVRQTTPVKRMQPGSGKVIKKDEYVPPFKHAPLVAQQNTLFNYGQAYRQINQLHGDFLHGAGYNGEGMLITAIDAGFNSANAISAFDSLFATGRMVSSWDFVDLQPGVYEDDAHGTEVLSTMAANVPGVIVGTAPRASYILLRSEDANTEYLVEEYNWAAAAAYADSAGSDVITSSLGYTEFDDPSMNHTYADMDGNTCPASIAADIASSKGMLVLVSAGNLGNGSWHYISSPADADSILAVGAVDSTGIKAGFSSWGPSADGDIKPNVAAMGLRSYLAYYDGSYGQGSGTSFSCPILAGASACLWQAHPDKSSMEILHAIQQSANYYSNPGDSLGYGIPNFQTADMLLGGTVINAPSTEQLVEVFPNPFDKEVYFSFNAIVDQLLQIEVLDMRGTRIWQDSALMKSGFDNRVRLNIPSQASSGIYLLKLSSANKTYFRKLIRQ